MSRDLRIAIGAAGPTGSGKTLAVDVALSALSGLFDIETVQHNIESKYESRIVEAKRRSAADYRGAEDLRGENDVLRAALHDVVTCLQEGRPTGALEAAEDALAGAPHRSTSLAAAVQQLVSAGHGAAVKAGWWHDLHTGDSLLGKRNIGETLMLIVTELAEAMEGHRKNLMDDKLPNRPMIEVELADALIRIADLGGALDLDLGGAVVEKMAYNATRADHKPENRRKAGGKAC